MLEKSKSALEKTWQGFRGLSTKSQALIVVSGLLVTVGIATLIVTTRPDPILQPEPEDKNEPDKSKVLPEGATGRATGIRVSPTFYANKVSVGSNLYPVTVSNGTTEAQKLNFYFVTLAGNNQNGIPTAKVTQKTINEGARVVAIDQKTATVGVGEETKINMKVVGEPGAPEFYGALVVEYGKYDKTPLSKNFKNNVRLSVNNVFQIIATRVLIFGQGKTDGVIQQVRGVQDEEEGGIEFSARVKNTGTRIDGIDAGTFRIVDSGGETVVSNTIEPGQGILPGNTREVQVDSSDVVKGLEPGNYQAVATVQMGSRTSTARWRFEIAEDGKLPSPGARAAATANPATPGTKQAFDVDIEVENTGTADFAPKLTAELVEFGQEKVLQRAGGELGGFSPGETQRGSFSFEGLPKKGNYEVVIQVESDDNIYLTQAVASVLVDDEKYVGPSFSDRLKDWMSANPIGTLLVGAALVALLIGLWTVLSAYLASRKKKPTKKTAKKKTPPKKKK